MRYITIPACSISDITMITKIEPFREWLSASNTQVRSLLSHMMARSADGDRMIRLVEDISMSIFRHARNRKLRAEGQLMCATLSEEYFTINIPLSQDDDFGQIRISINGNVQLNFPDPAHFMTQLAFTSLADKLMVFEDQKTTLRNVALILFADKVKPGLSSPFKDMIEEGYI